MADSVDAAIGELPRAEYIDDSDRIPMEQGGVAKFISGEQLKAFIDRNILGVRALTLPEGSDVTASYNAETGILTLGIPRSLGAANAVDGVAADTSGNVPLGAVSYDRGQDLSDMQKARARANLGLGAINSRDKTIDLTGWSLTQGAEQILPKVIRSGASAVAGGGSIVFNDIGGSEGGFIVTYGARDECKGIIVYYASANRTISYIKLVDMPDVSVTTGTGSITLVNNSSYYLFALRIKH